MSKWNYLLDDDDDEEYDSSKNFEKIKKQNHAEEEKVTIPKRKPKRIPRPDKEV